MQIRTTRKGLEALKFKFEPFERDSKHWNANSKHSKGIEPFECKFAAFECKFEQLKRDWKHWNANSKHSSDSKYSNENSNNSILIRSIQMQIPTIRKGFKAFECKFEPFERDSKHSNANSNNSKGIQSIRMQIRNTRKGLKH